MRWLNYEETTQQGYQPKKVLMSFPDDENIDGSQNIGLFTMRLLA
jgi:hypothetical protein